MEIQRLITSKWNFYGFLSFANTLMKEFHVWSLFASFVIKYQSFFEPADLIEHFGFLVRRYDTRQILFLL